MTVLAKYLHIFVCTLLALYFAMSPCKAHLPCGMYAKCSATANSTICAFDETANCIRKFPSKCHMNVAACKQRKNITDYNSEYCTMEAFLCEEGYERWTIFFGHEKVK